MSLWQRVGGSLKNNLTDITAKTLSKVAKVGELLEVQSNFPLYLNTFKNRTQKTKKLSKKIKMSQLELHQIKKSQSKALEILV